MKKILTYLITAFTFLACSKQGAQHRPSNGAATKPAKSFFDFQVQALNSEELVDLQQFSGKKIVVLNVASKCGYTPQYADWEAFYKANKDRVVVLGFPANNFMGQEPGSEADIAQFCSANYGVTFPMFEKISVKGDDMHPVYRWLSDKSMNGWNDQAPSWNFCKYVLNEKGELVAFFPSGVKPTDEEFKKALL